MRQLMPTCQLSLALCKCLKALIRNKNSPDYERAYRAPTTARELMTHTAGYVYEIWNGDEVQRAVSLGETESAFGGGGLLASPLAFQPGTKHGNTVSAQTC